MTFMVSVSVDVTEYPAIVLPEKTKVNEYQIVFHDHRSVVYIHLFTDDAKASGFSHLIDVVNSFAGSYSLSHVPSYHRCVIT